MSMTPGQSSANHRDGRQETILELRGVSKIFRDFWLRPRVKAVQDVDLTVRRGEVIGLLGPNGSGKTTTIKMVLGLLYPTAGQIAVLGKRPTDVGLKSRIGYLPEESHLYRFLNAEETLDFYGRLFHISREERRGRVESLLEMVGLSAARFRPVGEYSKGMQRRVGLAQALINDPDLLILDEPTTGMDPIATRQIKDLILTLKKRGKTIILCTHLLGEVEDVCDRLVIMYGGRIRAQGTVEEMLQVTGRQSIEVSGETPLAPQTLERIREVIAQDDGHAVESVHVPRQRLEKLFLDVIEQANRAGEQTTGAGIGGDVAGFLSPDQAEGEALLEQLARAERASQPAEEPAPQPVAPAGPDESILDVMTGGVREPADREEETVTSPARPAGAGKPAQRDPASAPARPATADPDADDAFLSDLTGKK